MFAHTLARISERETFPFEKLIQGLFCSVSLAKAHTLQTSADNQTRACIQLRIDIDLEKCSYKNENWILCTDKCVAWSIFVHGQFTICRTKQKVATYIFITVERISRMFGWRSVKWKWMCSTHRTATFFDERTMKRGTLEFPFHLINKKIFDSCLYYAIGKLAKKRERESGGVKGQKRERERRWHGPRLTDRAHELTKFNVSIKSVHFFAAASSLTSTVCFFSSFLCTRIKHTHQLIWFDCLKSFLSFRHFA